MGRMPRPMRTQVVIAGAAAVAAVALAGCSITHSGSNVINGKTLFVSKCGACHTLAHAGTTVVVGPNLDEASHRARVDGMKESTFEGMVYGQILNPNKFAQVDPKTGKELAAMPPNVVGGDDAQDVAAYVASAAGKGGKDQGRLAQVGAAQAKGTAKEKNGVLEIPADPGGSLSYV